MRTLTHARVWMHARTGAHSHRDRHTQTLGNAVYTRVAPTTAAYVVCAAGGKLMTQFDVSAEVVARLARHVCSTDVSVLR